MKSGASRVPLVLTAIAVLVLVGAVAVASSGSTPSGSGDTRQPSYVLFDTIFSLSRVAMLADTRRRSRPRVIGCCQLRPSKPSVDRMWSTLDVQAA